VLQGSPWPLLAVTQRPGQLQMEFPKCLPFFAGQTGRSLQMAIVTSCPHPHPRNLPMVAATLL
jgi:hypothetical protein